MVAVELAWTWSWCRCRRIGPEMSNDGSAKFHEKQAYVKSDGCSAAQAANSAAAPEGIAQISSCSVSSASVLCKNNIADNVITATKSS
ncbi:hypothetical protein ACLB2K_009016 [Fragaria x ananassa]